ncbi:NUDIX hydrolase [Kitasatospora sp. A2-31]|uniref:NUDIX hydrolase n=1 Tax=Kitasatospora sp. A2-31 TaxID=2916414 RepID=UPI001EEBA630|nr:NUDIX hydrolase [Kitasatospora sp. A2-31]MCG6495713.1 NUDIX hydrolase [Kitasatospora sp. A2-31]
MIDFDALTNLAAHESIERIGVGVVVRDTSGRILMIHRSAHDVLPGLWEYPGGGREESETVPEGAARELADGTGLTGVPLEYARHLDFTDQRGRRVRQFVFTAVAPDDTVIVRAYRLDLAAENPAVIARRRLVAVIHEQAGTEYPVPVCGYVFDGGVLTPGQQARIRLDPSEHTEWRFETAHDWRRLMQPARYQRLRQVLRAHRSGVPLYLERPATADDDFEGVLVFVTDAAGRLLMHHREDRPGMPWPGVWTPVGGWREADERAEETAVREVREEAGIEITGLRALPDPPDDLGLPLTRVLHAERDGEEIDLRLGDEGLAVRMVPLDEVLALKVPPYMQHYLPMLVEATGLPSGRAS